MGQLFRPRGAILRVELDQDEWLTAGLPPQLPVIMTSRTVLLAKPFSMREFAEQVRAMLRANELSK